MKSCHDESTESTKAENKQHNLDQASPSHDLTTYLSSLQASLQPLTRTASQLPGPSDLAFHKSIDRKVARKLESEASHIQRILGDIVKWAGDPADEQKSGTSIINHDDKGSTGISIDDEKLDAEGFAISMGDIVDGFLEKVDTSLDEYTGRIAPRVVPSNSNLDVESGKTHKNNAQTNSANLPKTGQLPPHILNAQITPPQRSFNEPPDNRADVPWTRPLRMGKPHALVPLTWRDPSLLEEGGDSRVVHTKQGMYCTEGDPRENPYHYEIMHTDVPAFVYERPTIEQLTAPPVIDEDEPDASSEESPFTWIDNIESLKDLLKHLKEDRVREIAIDLEHHSYRTYQGIVCLVQLSTRWSDYIIDALSPEVRSNFEMLNEVLADPTKVKILHGAEHDILWLQRDLGCYIVNMFDTYHATNTLSFPMHSLAYLLSRYYGFEADKRYQLADWRIRPLPKEMLYYARSDTHSLIYVYDCLRSELLNLPPQPSTSQISSGADAVRIVFDRSRETATKRYAKEIWDEEGDSRDGWRTIWKKWGGEEAKGTDERRQLHLMGRTERLIRKLHWWRDNVARQEDESPRYILSASNMLTLASRAPTTIASVFACLPPNLTPLRKRAPDLAQVVKDEVKQWEEGIQKLENKRREQLEKETNVENEEYEVGEKVTRESNVRPSTKTDSNMGSSQPDADKVEYGNASSENDKIVPSIWSPFIENVPTPHTETITNQGQSRGSLIQSALRLSSALFGNTAPVCNNKTSHASTSKTDGLSTYKYDAPHSLLFGPLLKLTPVDGVESPPRTQSLFQLPARSQASVDSQKISSIKSNIALSIKGVLGTSQKRQHEEDAEVPVEHSVDEDMQNKAPVQPEQVPFIPSSERVPRSDADGLVQATTRSHTDISENLYGLVDDKREDQNSDVHQPPVETDEGVIQVGKKKKARWPKEKKRRRSEEMQQPEDEFKSMHDAVAATASFGDSSDSARLSQDGTKDVKAKEKRSKVSKSMKKAYSGSKDTHVIPFDYSNAVSVLDAPTPSSSAMPAKRKPSKADGKRSTNSGKNSKGPVPAPRKRTEIPTGNKRMTFK